jgi:hypothetical protein
MGSLSIYWVAIAAGLVQILGYLDYLYQCRRDGSRPNPAAWGMWAFGAATHLWAYSQVTEGWVEDLLPAVCSVTCLMVFLTLLCRGKFRRSDRYSFTKWELGTFWGDVGITLLFSVKIFPASVAAIALQLDDLFTYIPTLKDLRENPSSEHPRPWVLWGVGYALQGYVVAAVGGGLVEWSYPLINLPLCFAVAYLCSKRKVPDPV